MRPDFQALVDLGPLPMESVAVAEDIARRQRLLEAVDGLALDADEIAALLGILPADGGTCFGLAWTVVHRIEASPLWPTEALDRAIGPWAAVLHSRLDRRGRTT